MVRWSPFAALLAVVSCTSGIDPNSGAAAQVNQLGGHVATPAGDATVTIGAGALGDQIIVAVVPTAPPVTPPAPAVSKVVEFTPHGTAFTVPARMTLKYDAKSASKNLRVLRLADEKAKVWEPVGGARFKDGVATFETKRFSYYTVADGYTCVGADPVTACNGACSADSFCGGGTGCVPATRASLCANTNVQAVLGEIIDYSGATPAETADAEAAGQIAQALASTCGATATTVSEADTGVLDVCIDAPLATAGTTLVVAGGFATQRVVRYLQQGHTPVSLAHDDAANLWTYSDASGATLRQLAGSDVTPGHDVFLVSLVPDAFRGALALLVYGIGEDGTRAAAWYFANRVLPDASFGNWALVEWTDDGNGTAGPEDTFTVLASH